MGITDALKQNAHDKKRTDYNIVPSNFSTLWSFVLTYSIPSQLSEKIFITHQGRIIYVDNLSEAIRSLVTGLHFCTGNHNSLLCLTNLLAASLYAGPSMELTSDVPFLLRGILCLLKHNIRSNKTNRIQ